jgi:hypothetical protein
VDNDGRNVIHYAVCSGCSPKVLHTLLTVGRAEIYETRTLTSAGNNQRDKVTNQENGVMKSSKLLPYFSINALYDCINGEMIASLSEASLDDAALNKLGNESKAGGDNNAFMSTLGLRVSTLTDPSIVTNSSAVEYEVRVHASPFVSISSGA